jgi:phosphoribosyl 1,2-cyclic phosphodiesterase
MIEICALASGSNGNCYYIGNEDDAILVDAGISCKQILGRMVERGLDAKKVRAVFISHEHSDHVRGIRVLGKRLDIPAYLTKGTFKSLYYTNQPQAARFFEPGEPVKIGAFTIHSFLKNHDASEPTSFRIESSGLNIGVFTDIGTACLNVTSQLNRCNAIFLETNYDEKMLWEGFYPYHLKKRIGSDVGHLSNKQAFDLLSEHACKELQCVFLSHLSAENNTPQKAYEEIMPLSCKFEVKLTSREKAGEVYELCSNPNKKDPEGFQNLRGLTELAKQLDLFSCE